MKKTLKVLAAILLVFVIMLPLVAFGMNSKDNKEIIAGDNFQIENNTNDLVTRAEFTKTVSENFEVSRQDVYHNFEDVSQNHWAHDYIQNVVNSIWMRGYEDNTFKPDKHILYEEALTVIVKILGLHQDYFDYPEDYIAKAIEYSVSNGINLCIGEPVTKKDVEILINNAKEYKGMLTEEDDADGWGIFTKSLSRAAISGGSGGHMLSDGVALEAMSDNYGINIPVFNTEEYVAEEENIFKSALISPLSTFSIDTDTASYSNMRRFILNGQTVPAGAIRTEELINYFDYESAKIEDGKPFGVRHTVAECPWNKEHKLAMITVSGEELKEYRPSNLVFLVDTSGSMHSYNKLPLVKQALSMLLDRLGEKDRISIVTYASGTQVALEPTCAVEKEKILNALNSLSAHGATAGADGIKLAYEQAEKYKMDNGNNRIILCTDGDFNIGASSTGELEKLIETKRETGIFLSVLGFGMGNYKDNRMETLADKGNGNYAYIDNLREAKKVLCDDMSKTIYTIAKDVKIQVEFNPSVVEEYRLIGYENRLLNAEDFDNDKKDAGELGAGSTVTALYEIIPAEGKINTSNLKYQTANLTDSDELMNVKIRYKLPDGDNSLLTEFAVENKTVNSPDEDFCFAAAVAGLGMIVNKSEYANELTYDNVIELARRGIGEDMFGLRSEFVQLVDLLRYAKN